MQEHSTYAEVFYDYVNNDPDCPDLLKEDLKKAEDFDPNETINEEDEMAEEFSDDELYDIEEEDEEFARLDAEFGIPETTGNGR